MKYTAELNKFRVCDSHSRIAYRFSSCPFVSFLLKLIEIQNKARKGMSIRDTTAYTGAGCASPPKKTPTIYGLQ